MTVATTAAQGEQAVEQASAGVDDVLFRLDQMGQSVASFCEGSPPAGVALPAGVANCSPSGTGPVPGAPGVVYTAVAAQSNQHAVVTSVAHVGGQTRTITADVYQLIDDFGIYGVTGVTFNGNGQSSVFEVDSQGNVVTNTLTNIDVGIGANGVLTCNGGLGGGVIVIPGPGATDSASCPPPKGVIDVTPQDPQTCLANQSTFDAFTPCIPAATRGFARDPSGNPYCPLPNLDGTNLAAGVDAYVPPAPPHGPNSIYDCATNGGPLNITSGGSGNPIPEGSYYIDSNLANIGDIDPGAFAAPGLGGPVNLFIMPAACYPAATPLNGQSVYAGGGCAAGSPAQGTQSTTTPNCDTTAAPPAQSLSLLGAKGGSLVNYDQNANKFGNPENLNVYWGGCGNIPIGNGSHTLQFGGNFYAPGGLMKANSQLTIVGSIVIGVLTSDGTPTIKFEYAEHQAKVLQGWTELNYHVSS
jgi:hypothetical protein